jgi:hypothetical protein
MLNMTVVNIKTGATDTVIEIDHQRHFCVLVGAGRIPFFKARKIWGMDI